MLESEWARRLMPEPGEEEHAGATFENYVTIFDFGFAPQGIALHQSLVRHGGNFRLWIISMDLQLTQLLQALDLQNVVILDLHEVENSRLREAKLNRTPREYCWTLTPFTFDFVFDRDPNVRRVTYIDADVFLLSDVSSVFREFEGSGKSVQITEHAYSPELDASVAHGTFCVQFLTMSRLGSEMVRDEWQAQCLEWCFGWVEPGRFGDQKYLDEWPKKYQDSVHISSGRGSFLGPWNSTRFPHSEALVYHFHQLRINFAPYTVSLGNYPLPEVLVQAVYWPYVEVLRSNYSLMRQAGFEAREQIGQVSGYQRFIRFISTFADPVYKRVQRVLKRS